MCEQLCDISHDGVRLIERTAGRASEQPTDQGIGIL
jgi:hypothetical protein